MNFMKTLKVAAVSLMLMGTLAACDRVEPGTVGVKVHMLGGEKGVDQEVLGPGRYWIGYNERLYIFPTFAQTAVWTADSTEGSPTDESITFQTIEGLSVNADFGVTYTLRQEKVSDIFQRYRMGVDELTSKHMRNAVRDALQRHASNKPVESVYGAGKTDLMAAVTEDVRAVLGPLGIEVESIYVVGDFRLPQTVVASINAKIEATQKAQQRQNEVAQARAEAEKQIEAARGVAESISIQAQAQAEANRKLAASLTPELVQYEAIQKWNGTLPTVTAPGAMPLINLQPGK